MEDCPRSPFMIPNDSFNTNLSWNKYLFYLGVFQTSNSAHSCTKQRVTIFSFISFDSEDLDAEWCHDMSLNLFNRDILKNPAKIVAGGHGLLYNDMFKAYAIERMPINVFDTPGFFDSDQCRNEENKKQIASRIGNKLDMFAYFMNSDNSKMDSNIQNIFTILQEWTMGR